MSAQLISLSLSVMDIWGSGWLCGYRGISKIIRHRQRGRKFRPSPDGGVSRAGGAWPSWLGVAPGGGGGDPSVNYLVGRTSPAVLAPAIYVPS